MKEGRFCFQVLCLERNGLRFGLLVLEMNRLPKEDKTEELFNHKFLSIFHRINTNHDRDDANHFICNHVEEARTSFPAAGTSMAYKILLSMTRHLCRSS